MARPSEVQLFTSAHEANHPSGNSGSPQHVEQCWCPEAGTYSTQKAHNSVEERIAAARSAEGWSHLLKTKLHEPMDIAAWGNGRGRGWANGGGGGGGFADARYGGGWGNGGGWRNGSGAWGNGGGGAFRNW